MSELNIVANRATIRVKSYLSALGKIQLPNLHFIYSFIPIQKIMAIKLTREEIMSPLNTIVNQYAASLKCLCLDLELFQGKNVTLKIEEIKLTKRRQS